jgi:hypothetical protein
MRPAPVWVCGIKERQARLGNQKILPLQGRIGHFIRRSTLAKAVLRQ